MAPTCDSFDKCDGAKASEGAAVPSTSSSCTCSTDSHDDNGPFYGMFDSRDYEGESDWVHRTLASSPRGTIPEASETFIKAMRQMDTTRNREDSSRISSASGGARPKESSSSSSSSSARSSSSVSVQTSPSDRPRKSSKLVKKSASFSAQTSSTKSSSSSSRADDKKKSDAASRRMSVPCMRGEKHVQWADEAGVADLVSVRLIRPRISVGEKEKHPSPVRSILRRLTGSS